MATSEIEKLERRYAENPHGLTFAPLAEVHRKNGDVPRALELLTAGLELHPNYIPASIVLGRCHQDLGDLLSAEAAFAHVLSLDDENVIALKSLADINERLERFGEAGNWLRRLVSVDRSNDEARDQLRRLESMEKEVEVAGASAETSAPALEVIDLDPEPVAESPDAVAPSPEVAVESPKHEAAPQELLPVDLAALESSQMEVERSSAFEAAHDSELTEALAVPEDVAAAMPAEAPAPAFAPDMGESSAIPEEEAVQPVAGLISAEFEPPLEAIGGLGVETSEEVVLEVSGNSEFRVPDASEDFRILAEAPHQTAEEVSAPEPEPLPPKAPVEEVPAGGVPAARRSYVASETKGRSVASFFHSLLAARPWAEPGFEGNSAHSGSPGSLAGDENALVPPAMPAADQKGDGAVSFDDFFGSEGDGSTPLRQRADPGKDDLDQFQSWLQNLKR